MKPGIQCAWAQRVVATVPVDDPSVFTICGGGAGRVPCAAGAGPWAWPLMPAAQGPQRSPGSRPARRAVAAGDAQQPGGRRGGPGHCAAPLPGNERRRQPPPQVGLVRRRLAVQDLGQRLGRGLPAQRLAGPAVQLVRDRGQVRRAVPGQGGALGEVLAQQPVGVLVAAPLPGRVRVAEVDLAVRGHRDLRVRAHLPALVPGQRPAQRIRQPRDHRRQRLRHRRPRHARPAAAPAA